MQVVDYRLRKFDTAEAEGAEPRMIWVRWFRTEQAARDYAVADSPSEVVWIGNAALSEDHTYDLKKIEITV